MNISDVHENYSTGWIKLFRSLSNKGWYSKSEYVHLWIHILIKANHKGKEFMFGGKNIVLNPGQFVTGRKALELETGINENKIERILNFFSKTEQQIEQQKSNKNRVITVVMWDRYQQSEQQTEQQLNNNRTTTEQQLNTNKNVKNVKNEKKYLENEKKFKKEIFEFSEYPSSMLNQFFDYWSEPNKSKTKMRFENENTWDLSRRLKRWRSNNFGKQKTDTGRKITEDITDFKY